MPPTPWTNIIIWGAPSRSESDSITWSPTRKASRGPPRRIHYLITSAAPAKLDAQRWLELIRAGFGSIENGLHRRLDVSHNNDRCRIRHPYAMFVTGLFRRIGNSLFLEWSSHQPHPEHLTTTDFQAAMSEDHCRPAMRLFCQAAQFKTHLK